MKNINFEVRSKNNEKIKSSVNAEIGRASAAVEANDLETAFHHLERAHVIGQSRTLDHTRVHWRMLKIGWRRGDWREIVGQLFRIVGASTKTPFGIYPTGNTGGANVWFFKPMPVPPDLRKIIEKER